MSAQLRQNGEVSLGRAGGDKEQAEIMRWLAIGRPCTVTLLGLSIATFLVAVASSVLLSAPSCAEEKGMLGPVPSSWANSSAGPTVHPHLHPSLLQAFVCCRAVLLLQPDGALPPPDAKPTYHDVTATIAEVRRITLPLPACS